MSHTPQNPILITSGGTKASKGGGVRPSLPLFEINHVDYHNSNSNLSTL